MPRLSKIGAAALAAFGWTGLSTVTASYLVVAGGGGAGGVSNDASGGGGAGGLLAGTTSLNPTLSYTVTVGAGGTGGASGGANNGVQGSSSIFNSLTAVGGGYGGGGAGGGVTNNAGGAGGSGGGSSNNATTAAGTSGQGSSGGATYGGGGGQSGAGSATAFGGTNNGGAGYTSSISGTSTTYAGGGCSGGSQGNTYGGGNGSYPVGTANNTAGTANKGGGGGGAWSSSSLAGGNGGSGVVIISYPSPQKFGGGVVTTSGSNVIHTFQTSGTLSPLSTLSASYLIVAGGGGGGYDLAGGGGAGGLLSGSGVTIDTNSTYLVTVGSGGTGGVSGSSTGASGGNSTFSMVSTTVVGGGGGPTVRGTGVAGGSGGGAGGDVSNTGPWTGGAGTSGQGNAGGGANAASTGGGGGGGGAGAVGGTGTSSSGGAGGVGLTSSISGTSTYYAGGGGGSGYSPSSITGGAGGNGGGGAGNGGNTGTGTSGTANTGGGGGAGSGNGGLGGAGGSGVVIISYAGSVQQMAGGTVTIVGGNVIHTFTSSGYLTPLKFVGNSLRTRSSASAYLSRTFPTAGSSYKFTQSFWCKRGSLGTYQAVGYGTTSPGTVYSAVLRFSTSDTLDWYCYYNGSSWTGQLSTTQVFRDPASWYHIVISADTTQATSSERLKMYVNGVQVTALSTASYPPQNTVLVYNGVGNANYQINAQNTGSFFDGYITELNYIDGQALTPSSFGSFNSYGVWQPITYGGSYGTNGFYLPFNKPSTSTYAASFNGTSQSISVASNSVFNFAGAFTVECWLNTSTVTNVSQPCLFSIGSDAAGLVLTYSSGNFYGYFVGTGGLFSGVSYTPYLNSWVHIAWVRQVAGGTHYLYVNGIQVATGSSGGTVSSTGGVTVGKAGSSGTAFGYLSGTVSNFRVNNTALYTANFIPSTSPLTAVTGTQLLTLQNSTIIDNSTNAFSITNNGTVTTSANTNVFVNPTTLAVDQSPAGNNWTTNNISLTAGSTYDSMTDVPTLTSTTVANYPTLNPLNASTTAAANNANLQAYSTSGANTGAAGINCTMALPTTGLYYFEVTMSAVSAAGLAGIAKLGATQDTNFGAGAYANIYAYTNTSGVAYANNATAYTGSTLTTGDILGVAVDMTNGALYFAKNNTWQNSGVPTSGASKTGAISFTVTNDLLPTCYVWKNSGADALSINFGQRPFTYTAPSGYVNLNTWNL